MRRVIKERAVTSLQLRTENQTLTTGFYYPVLPTNREDNQAMLLSDVLGDDPKTNRLTL